VSSPTVSDVRILDALVQTFVKLDPRAQVKNPVMFTVYLGAILTSILTVVTVFHGPVAGESLGFGLAITLWLWATVLFSNLAEAVAEGRGKAQAAALRRSRSEVKAVRLAFDGDKAPFELVASSQLKKGDLVRVTAGEVIPADGEVVRGAATVDESAITGESAPVVREAGGDRSSVTGGTRVLSDTLVVKIAADPGQGFLDRMIALVEGAQRQRTPNEVALTILLVTLTAIFLVVTVTLWPFSVFSVSQAGHGSPLGWVSLIALFVCLAPTTIGALLSAIGIAGMNRLSKVNVLATSGRAVEASGDVDILLLDKTGTITLGNRMADSFFPAEGVHFADLAQAALLASWGDTTPEGRSILTLALNQSQVTTPHLDGTDHTVHGFTAQTRMSGLDWKGHQYRKGAPSSMEAWARDRGQSFPGFLKAEADQAARQGATPLAVGVDGRLVGLVVLKDIVKDGIRAKFADLRTMGIKTIMVTGDNPLTAATIAAEAGVDDFVAEAKPEDKLALIRRFQAEGHLVAMTGDGTNDAPALAQADVAVAMNSGTQASKEAANMVDLDSNPTKLTEVVVVGKQLLVTRGALTTFSIANDVAKYFAILPALFLAVYPGLAVLNIMHLATPESSILSAVIFNALIIPLLIPLALRGVVSKARSAAAMLRRNLLIYGFGGLVLPFVGIKVIDVITTAHLW
jgi:K+-transporting ATPase ATPase B chain